MDRLAELRLQAGLVRDELQAIAADRIRRRELAPAAVEPAADEGCAQPGHAGRGSS